VTELSVTDLRNRLLEVIRRVEVDGEEVVVVRHGRRVARLVPEPTPASAVLGVDVGRVVVTDPDDDLFSTGEAWDAG
jgi:prevent-host-death family protein